MKPDSRSGFCLTLIGFPSSPTCMTPSPTATGSVSGQYTRTRRCQVVLVLVLTLTIPFFCWAVGAGSISGTVRDPTDAVIAGATLTLVHRTLKSEYKAATDSQGSYTFPSLPVGHYDLTIQSIGFKTQEKTNLVVNTDAALKVDVALEVGEQYEKLTVSITETAVETQVETVATQLGEVVSSARMVALPLNGRSFTDLLAIQPGISPATTLQPNSVIMAGVTGTIAPSGDLNPGNLSIDGQRESSNGFVVNGIDVQEHMNGGTSIVPNLDSIDEFRVLTNSFDPEYGNYNGGMVIVVTKSGSDSVHGSAFEFLRNTILDARGYFDPTRPDFHQNQFGGVLGGPIKRQEDYFFLDYQGTRTNEGVETGLISVPSVQDGEGDLYDMATSLTGTVSGPYLANLLSKKFGYAVSAGEPYHKPGCTTSSFCVFPNAVIPKRAWSSPAIGLLKYIPAPNVGTDQFSTSAFPQTLRDDKISARVDAKSRWGQISAYYFLDDYRLDNPYPRQQGGASIPGFDAITFGRAQLISLGNAKIFGAGSVNEFHLGLLRNANVIGQPHGGLGVSLAEQGFVSGKGTPGIIVQAPQFEGVENIAFPSFVMGVPTTNVAQFNDTLYLSNSVSKVLSAHTLKLGGQFHVDLVNEHPNATFNGTFNMGGAETGNSFADFLIGVPSNFTQSSGQAFYLRNRYAGLFVQDSWRMRSDLTFNFGLRWDYIMPFWEKYNQLQTVIPGRQSVVFPHAPGGLMVAGDPGIPNTISPAKSYNFAPRLGLAYAPTFKGGILKRIFGASGKTSIRTSFGMFYTALPGLSAGIMYAVTPFGYNYLSPQPPLFATPFINAASGGQNIDPFPLTFPSHSASAKNPDTSFDFARAVPISADPYFYDRNDVPYTENYMFSFQRQITASTLLRMSYVGNQSHHLLALFPANPSNQALCLSLSQPNKVAVGSPTCGPYAEDAVITSSRGQVFHGTRVGLGPNYGEATAQKTIGNSNYDALQVNLRYVGSNSNLLLGYVYSKSIDQASNLGEQLNPFDPSGTRAISAFDMKHNFVGSYTMRLPFDVLFKHTNQLTTGWSISGITRFSTGFPVTLFDDSDNSLLGTLGNGVNNYLLDTPNYNGAALEINKNQRNGRPAFNISAFSPEKLGQLGNSSRRFFYGPGINNFDLTLAKLLRVTGSKSFEFRLEAFNAFNHAQFYGAGSVDGEVNDPHFGNIVSAAAPRLLQIATKLSF